MISVKNMMQSLASNKFEKLLLDLRNDPLRYMADNKLTEEDILQCISKIVISGEIEFSRRLPLLFVLQEHSTSLITTIESLEEVIGGLSNYYEQLKSASHNFFKGQILVTITYLFLNDEHSSTETFTMLLVDHCDRLWQIFLNVNNKENCILREIACECLLQIEEHFPNIFIDKLEELSVICFKENMYPFQSYSNLMSCVLKNLAAVTSSERVNEILVMMKRTPIEKDVNHYISKLKANTIANKLLDFVPLFSTASILYIVSNIVSAVKLFNLNPLILKTFVHRYMLSSDMGIANLLLILKNVFEDALFSKTEATELMQLMLHRCNHVGLTEYNRSLILGWISKYIINQKADLSQNTFVTESLFYLPQPLDSMVVRENKLEIFSKLLPFFKDKDWNNREFLVAVNCINSQLVHDNRGYYITALCRILYSSLLCQNDPILEAEYQRICLSVMKHNPQFAMYILNLIKSVKSSKGNGMFFYNVLSTSVHHVTCLPFEAAQLHLHHYLLFLEEAALENSEYSQPKAIVLFLRRLLDYKDQKRSSELNWLLGHAMLNVCKNVLCYHNSNYLYPDLGDLLHTIVTRYDDIDVSDRARFYYMLLTTLSSKKISAMFQPKINKAKSKLEFTTFVADDSTYGFPVPVLHLNTPILNLVRILNIVNEQDLGDIEDATLCVDVDEYFRWLGEYNLSWKATFDFRLEIVANADDAYNNIYGIVLSFTGPKHGVKIPTCTISFELRELEPHPVRIAVSAVFSASNGQTCCNNLRPLDMEFRDLFQPLPVPPKHGPTQRTWRKNLANALWKTFKSVTADKRLSCDYHQSIMRLLIDENQYQHLMKQELLPFITENESNDSQKNFTAGIFLPTESHLILKVHYAPDQGAIVRLATDNRKLLAQTTLYFHKCEKSLNKTIV